MSGPRGILSEPEDLPLASDFVGLTRNSLVFALGAIAGKAVGLVMLPVLTRSAYPGRLREHRDGPDSLRGDLRTAVGAGVLAALRLYFDQPDDASRGSLATWLVIGLAVSGVGAVVIVWQASALTDALFRETSLELGVAAVAVVVVAQTVQVIASTVLRAGGRAWLYALLSGGVLVLYAGIAVIFCDLARGRRYGHRRVGGRTSSFRRPSGSSSFGIVSSAGRLKSWQGSSTATGASARTGSDGFARRRLREPRHPARHKRSIERRSIHGRAPLRLRRWACGDWLPARPGNRTRSPSARVQRRERASVSRGGVSSASSPSWWPQTGGHCA